MTWAEAVGIGAQWGLAGFVICAVTWAIFTNRLFLRREVDTWQERYGEMRAQRDTAFDTANTATDIAKDSSEKLTEVVSLLRAFMAVKKGD